MKQENTTRGGEHFDKIIFNDNNLFLLSVFSRVMLEGICQQGICQPRSTDSENFYLFICLGL